MGTTGPFEVGDQIYKGNSPSRYVTVTGLSYSDVVPPEAESWVHHCLGFCQMGVPKKMGKGI